jgi:hypothetical protein
MLLTPDLVVADEAHVIKNERAKGTQVINSSCVAVYPGRRLIGWHTGNEAYHNALSNSSYWVSNSKQLARVLLHGRFCASGLSRNL